MATLMEELTDSDPYAADAKAAIVALAGLDSQAAKFSFDKTTHKGEVQSMRNAAREAGFTLAKITKIPAVESADGLQVTEAYKLRAKITPAAHTRPNRKSKSNETVEPTTGD